MVRTCIAALLWILPVCLQATTSVYEEAAALLQRGETDTAIRILEHALEQSPNDLKARTLMGMAYSAAGRLDDAVRQFSQALEIDPRFAPALKNLALNELAQGQVSKAKSHFETLLQVTPGDPVAHLASAEIQFGRKNYSRAVAHFRKSGDLYLRDPRTIIEYAQACVAEKQNEEAARLLSQVPKEADAQTHFQAGTLLALVADYTGAARQLELAKDRYPDKYEVGYNLTLAYIKGANYAAAIRTGEGLIAQGYKKAELYNLLSQAYESKGMTHEAYDALRTATQNDPADETNYIDLVALCLTHKNYGLALEIANIGLANRPSSDRLVVQRGIVFAMTEKFDDARKAFEVARTMAPEKGLPHVALGLILMQNDRTDDAIRVLRQRVQTGPDDYLALWFLAEALNRAGATPGTPQMTEAIDAVERSVRLNADVAQSQMLLAKLLTRAGKLDPAVAHLTRALQLEPDNVSAMYQLAQVYSRKGDAARAKELFAKVGKAKAEDREQFTSRGLAQIIREGAK